MHNINMQSFNQLNLVRSGLCYRISKIFSLPSTDTFTKYFLFDPTSLCDNKDLLIFPISYVPDGQKLHVYYRTAHDYSGGSELSFINLNEHFSTTTDVRLYENPTGTNTGISFSENLIGSSGPPGQMVAGMEPTKISYIKTNNSTVLVEIVKHGNVAVDFELNFVFGEICC